MQMGMPKSFVVLPSPRIMIQTKPTRYQKEIKKKKKRIVLVLHPFPFGPSKKLLIMLDKVRHKSHFIFYSLNVEFLHLGSNGAPSEQSTHLVSASALVSITMC